MDPATILLVFGAVTRAALLLRDLLTTAKQNKELTPEQEAAFDKALADFRASPAGQVSPAGKL